MRLDLELVERNLTTSRTNAAALISDGRVLVNGKPAAKAGLKVLEGDVLEIVPGQTPDFVSRAGQKLYGALQEIPDLSVTGLRCLDAGASTGGFTDVLLQAGARQVVAVDVGHDQLVPSLRADERVDVHEGLNVRHLDPEMIGGTVDLTVADLSFISLTLVMDGLMSATRPGGELLLMIKPQFEIGRAKLGAGGVVRDPYDRQTTVRRVLEVAEESGLQLLDVKVSPLPGQDGNKEYFARWRMPGDETSSPLTETDRKIEVDDAIQSLKRAGDFDG